MCASNAIKLQSSLFVESTIFSERFWCVFIYLPFALRRKLHFPESHARPGLQGDQNNSARVDCPHVWLKPPLHDSNV